MKIINVTKYAQSDTAIEPKYIVCHYTADGGSSDRDAMNSIEYLASIGLSYHYVISRDGTIYKMTPDLTKANHAGRSEWKGLFQLNSHSIGIAFCNAGWLDKRDAVGYYRDGTQKFFSSRVLPDTRHKNGGRNLAWEKYTVAQRDAAMELVRQLKNSIPSIEDVLGHDDIAPDRKLDPGPAFDSIMTILRGIVRNQEVSSGVPKSKGTHLVNARNGLNLRALPSVDSKVMKVLHNNTPLTVLNKYEDWCVVDLENDGVADGYVWGAFLVEITT